MPFNKIILLALMVLAVGAGAAFAATKGTDSSVPADTTMGTTSVVDVKGPCDEAEHASDPRCAGAQVPEDNDAAENEDANDDNGQADDDPAENEDVDDDDRANHDAGDDRGGESSGPSADDDNSGSESSGPSDSSGPGGGDDSGSDDGGHSGHGGGDD
jgi:hypothetical protein